MIRFLKRNKIFSLLCFISIICFIFGSFFFANLDIKDKEIVSHNIYELLFHQKSYFTFLLNYGFCFFLIWILGISIIGVFFILFLYSYMVFIIAFEFTACISTFGFSSIMMILLYCFPKIIMLLFSFILSYYASLFSNYLMKHLFFHKEYSFSSIMKQYIKIYLLSFVGLFFSTFIEYLNYRYLFKIFY